MARCSLLLLAGLLVCLSGCAKTSAPSAAPTPPIYRQTVFHDEGHVDTEPCCAPLNEWMPLLFSPAKPRARLTAEDMPVTRAPGIADWP